MTKYSMLLLLLTSALYAGAQKHITISGYISEKSSGERLLGAVIVVPEKNIGTISNTYGFFSLTIPDTTRQITLRVSYIGYSPVVQTLRAEKDTQLNFRLEETNTMEEVVITSQKDALQTKTQMSSIDLPIQTIKSLPAFMGETDIMKAIQLLPGIQAGGEGSSGLYVRGGGTDQNLILLDGVPVYNASHLFGFFSVFNADAIRNVEVIKGGFPARYGGRLSSVIDISMKEGDKNKLHGEGAIGLVASRLTLEGPIQKGKSSFMISGRRTYIDLIARPIIKAQSDGLTTGYYFYDLNGKVNFQLGKKDHIYFSGYFGNDKFYAREKLETGMSLQENKTNLKWGNATAVGRWNHEFGPKLFGNLTTYYSRYLFDIMNEDQSTQVFNNEKDVFRIRYFSGIEDLAAKYDFDYLPGSGHFIKAGVSYINHTYSPGALHTKVTALNENVDTTIGSNKIFTNEIDAYIEDDIRITSKLKANIGVHWTGFTVKNNFYNAFQPRVALRYLITDELSAKASYVQMNQFIHLLTNSSVGLPTDLWVPVTGKLPMQVAHQGAAGLAYTHSTGIEVSLEGYYKTMQNVIEYKEGASFINSANDWEDKVTVGKGRSYGGELFVQKKKGKFTGMLGYTLSWTKRQFDDLNNGREFPYRYDRRHDLKIAGVYSLSKRIELSAEWVYGTGNAITLPVGIYQVPGSGSNTIIYGERNAYRMASYHRGDVSIKFMRQRKRYERAWIIGVYNVYNRQNPFYITTDEDQGGYTVFKQISLFPVIPSISYQFKF
jgi:hypothetical protein